MIKRIVALKTIRADQLAGENAETIIARFRREAQAAGRLNHPNIVSIYDFGEDAGIWYIAMEFVKGRELKDYFEANERFATGRHRAHHDADPGRARLLAQAGRHPPRHQAGERHPAAPTASVKVADFGIAHIESSNMTQVGTVIGTPSYMSPEQIMGLADRRPLRSLLRRRHPLPVPDRRASVHRLGDDHDAQGAGGGSAAAVALQRAGAGRDGRRRAQGAREARRRALSRPPRSSPPRCAPRRAAQPRRSGATTIAPPAADATRRRAPPIATRARRRGRAAAAGGRRRRRSAPRSQSPRPSSCVAIGVAGVARRARHRDRAPA